jgi:hypothetical protein
MIRSGLPDGLGVGASHLTWLDSWPFVTTQWSPLPETQWSSSEARPEPSIFSAKVLNPLARSLSKQVTETVSFARKSLSVMS